MSSEEIIGMLHENALYEVPVHITITDKQWGSRPRKLYIEEVTLLRCRSEDILRKPYLETINAFDFRNRVSATQTLLFCVNILTCLRKRSKRIWVSIQGAAEKTRTGAFRSLEICPKIRQVAFVIHGIPFQLYEIRTPICRERDELYPDKPGYSCKLD